MTLIEERQPLDSRILGKRTHDLDANVFDESGSDDEFLIASEGYPEDVEQNNNRDFFSLPTLGLNYFNNLNLSLNLNLNLRNTPLWRIYENTSFTKPGFFTNYLGKHNEDVLDIGDHDISPDSRGYFTITNFLRRHGFQSDEDEFSEEAILERVRFKRLQKQAAAQARKLAEDENSDNFVSALKEKTKFSSVSLENLLQGKEWVEDKDEKDVKVAKVVGENEVLIQTEKSCGGEIINEAKDMSKNSSSASTTNPFYNRVEVGYWDIIKIVLLTCILLPIKVILMIVVLMIALLLSLIGMCGMSFEDSQAHPLSAWRRAVRWVIANIVMRAFVFCTGFIWSVSGKRAEPEEAPIFVVGPHSSYFDAFAVILLGAPSVVAKLSTKDIPIFGRLVTYTQALYVSRENKGSRKHTVEVMKNRAQGVYRGNGMPQIFIFPEGTCSNRSSLIKFKVGAFAPQVPVQPVLIRYPNKFDTVTWTFDGPPVLRNVWYALAQFYNKIEIEYLPVYVPNEQEKNDPSLYAENVRRVMAEALDVPRSEYQFEDGILLCSMTESNLVPKLRSIYRAKKALGLSGSSIESAVIKQNVWGRNFDQKFQQFQREFFRVSTDDTVVPEVQAVFSLFQKEEGVADIRSYLWLTCFLYEDKLLRSQDVAIKTMCQMFEYKYEALKEEEFKMMMKTVFEVSQKEHRPISTTSSASVLNKDAQKPPYLSSDDIKERFHRYFQFTKLYADEVAERIPKTYPRREDRDKLPKKKLKSE